MKECYDDDEEVINPCQTSEVHIQACASEKMIIFLSNLFVLSDTICFYMYFYALFFFFLGTSNVYITSCGTRGREKMQQYGALYYSCFYFSIL